MEAPACEANCSSKGIPFLKPGPATDTLLIQGQKGRPFWNKFSLSQEIIKADCMKIVTPLIISFNVFSTMVHLPTSLPLLLQNKSNITLIVNFAPANLSSKQITHYFSLSTEQSTCQPLCHLWVQVPQRKSPTPRRSSAAHRQVVSIIVINHGRDHGKRSYHHVMIYIKHNDHQGLLAPDPPKLPCLLAHTHGQLGPASQAIRDVACGNQSGN